MTFTCERSFWTSRLWAGLLLALAAAHVAANAHSSPNASAATTESPHVPRIGVVLGGGGARGFAHLGVLQELEKMHIPIACIAGTSAGALVGGMYANGLSLDSMKQNFHDADWSALLSGQPVRSDVPYERKSDDYKNYFGMTFGMRAGQFRVPRSAINSQEVDLYIRRLTRDRNIDSFDHLPIPFRAVATDLATGDAVVFDRGPLAVALRASMAVPGLFSPLSNEGRLLVDGGMARNLPIQELKNRCADHVIVVDVGTPLLKANEINNMFDVLVQTSNLAIARNVAEQKKLLDDQDVVIKPNLDGFTVADFSENQAIIQRGVAAVGPLRARLQRWSIPAAQYRAWHARLLAPESPKIDKIQVAGSGLAYINPEQVTAKLVGAGEQPNLNRARSDLRRLFASGDYESLTYQIEHVDGQNVMRVTPMARSIGPTYLRFGVDVKSSSTSDATINFLGSSVWTWVNSAGASWRNDAMLGSNKMLRSEFYQPLGLDSPFFIAAQAHYKDSNWPFYDSDHRKYAELTLAETGAELDGGVALGQYGQMRAGVYWQRYSPSLTMGELTPIVALRDQKANEAGVRVSAVIDQFDNPRWPRRGYYLNSEARYSVPQWNGVNTRYYALTAEDALTFNDVTLRMTGKLQGNMANRDANRFLTPQFLGGFLNMSGYEQDELYGEKVALGRMMVYWRAATLPSAIGTGVYAGASLEVGKVWRQSFSQTDSLWLPGGSVFVGADTLIGPFFIGVGHAKGGRPMGYMYLGMSY